MTLAKRTRTTEKRGQGDPLGREIGSKKKGAGAPTKKRNFRSALCARGCERLMEKTQGSHTGKRGHRGSA